MLNFLRILFGKISLQKGRNKLRNIKMFCEGVKYIMRAHWYEILSDLHDYNLLRQERNKAKKECLDSIELCKHFNVAGKCTQIDCLYYFRNKNYVNALKKFENLTKAKSTFWNEKFSRVK